MRIFGLLVLVLVGGMAYIRLAPIKAAAFATDDLPRVVGDVEVAEGFTAVRPLNGETEAVLGRIKDAMMALPSTQLVSSDPLTFVTRSKVFGFPDVTVAVARDGLLIVRGHLVFGKNDLGVNKARILRILNAL